MAMGEIFAAGDKVTLTKNGSWFVTGKANQAVGATGVVLEQDPLYQPLHIYRVLMDNPDFVNRHGYKGDKAYQLTCMGIDHEKGEASSG